MSDDTVTRKIYFYRMYHLHEDGSHTEVDKLSLMDRIGRLTFPDGKAYLALANGRSMCAWPHTSNNDRLILGMARSRGLPEVEENGIRTSLPLSPQQNLLESTHAVLFRDGIVGAEYNFYGPRFIKFRDYVADKFPDLPITVIDPLSDRDVVKKLQDLETLTQLEIRLHRDYVDLLRQASGSLAAGYDAIAEMSDAPVIKITLQQEPRSRKSFGAKLREILESIVGEPLVREAADVLMARGQDRKTGRTRDFDFLRDNFATTEVVALQDRRSRAVDSEDMFKAIEKAYNEMEFELRHAAGFSI